MKSQKIKDIIELSIPELEQKILENEEESFKLRLQHASKQLTDPSKMRVLRRNKARYLTILHQKGLTKSSVFLAEKTKTKEK